MRTKTFRGTCGVLIAVLIATSNGWAAKRKQAAPAVQLTEAGQKLEAHYAKQLETSNAEIIKALPQIDEAKLATYLNDRAAEEAAEADMNAKQATLGKCRGAGGLLNHRKNWIAKATTGVAEAKATLKQAEAMTGDARRITTRPPANSRRPKRVWLRRRSKNPNWQRRLRRLRKHLLSPRLIR
jgi:hypothetical protein